MVKVTFFLTGTDESGKLDGRILKPTNYSDRGSKVMCNNMGFFRYLLSSASGELFCEKSSIRTNLNDAKMFYRFQRDHPNVPIAVVKQLVGLPLLVLKSILGLRNLL